MQKKIFFSIGLVFYSGEKFLLECIQTLLDQTEKNYEILFQDNSEDQRGRKFLEKKFSQEIFEGKIKIFPEKKQANPKNLWHSGGHNFLFQKSKGKFYVCGSIDMKYTEKFLEILQKNIPTSRHPSIYESDSEHKCAGSLAPTSNPSSPQARRSRTFSSATATENSGMTDAGSIQKNFVFTGTILNWTGEKIDSAGLEKNIFGQVRDRWQDSPSSLRLRSGTDEKIFGASGALFAIEKKFVEKKLGGKIFNEKLHYKNDSFLFYDLFYKGYKTLYIPEIFAYHDRKVGKNTKKSAFEIESSYTGQKEIFTKIILQHGTITEKICGGIFVALQWCRMQLFQLI